MYLIELIQIFGCILFIFFIHRFVTLDKKRKKLISEVSNFEKENIDNHRLTFYCTCNSCIRKYGI